MTDDANYRLHNQVGMLRAELFDKESKIQMLEAENRDLKAWIKHLQETATELEEELTKEIWAE